MREKRRKGSRRRGNKIKEGEERGIMERKDKREAKGGERRRCSEREGVKSKGTKGGEWKKIRRE